MYHPDLSISTFKISALICKNPGVFRFWWIFQVRYWQTPHGRAANSLPAEKTRCNRTASPDPAAALYSIMYQALLGDANLRQYRIILSADTASEVQQLLSQKRR